MLPPDIRVMGTAFVPLQFDARFDCLFRRYRYFFLRGDLDLEAMRVAASLLVGEHDFRNFCKIDTAHVSNFVRVIVDTAIVTPQSVMPAPSDVCYFEVTGFAFLWHQVRCMMAVLTMVGEKAEPPSVITDLLDTERMPRKPQYALASELPLVLYECGFENLHFVQPSADTQARLVAHVRDLHARAAVASTLCGLMLSDALGTLAPAPDAPGGVQAWASLALGAPAAAHVPLRKRKTEDSYDEKFAKLSESKRKRLKKQHEDTTREQSAEQDAEIGDSEDGDHDFGGGE
eukprot:TRINITY_DN4513_c0_g1_i2.p1 TRINITY_DN4513_c0_g1~~TRINITY_DN4513_c0_g1_i2.p1  ORF type:complete len:288 (+),score=59.96 TRINITY_DN4513_c0_g1_i2:450-1313(+)